MYRMCGLWHNGSCSMCLALCTGHPRNITHSPTTATTSSGATGRAGQDPRPRKQHQSHHCWPWLPQRQPHKRSTGPNQQRKHLPRQVSTIIRGTLAKDNITAWQQHGMVHDDTARRPRGSQSLLSTVQQLAAAPHQTSLFDADATHGGCTALQLGNLDATTTGTGHTATTGTVCVCALAACLTTSSIEAATKP